MTYVKVSEFPCPYSAPIRDSTHLRKCDLRVGVCSERSWRYEYSVCQTFLDGEAELKKKKADYK